MIQKLKDKVRKLNLKKSFIILAVVSIVFAIGAGLLLNQTFGGRVAQARETYTQQWEQYVQEYEENLSERPEVTEPESKRDGTPGGVSDGYNHGFERWESQRGHSVQNRFQQFWGGKFSELTLESEWTLTTGEKVMIAVVVGGVAVLGILYWLLCMVWAYQKASKLGSKPVLWVIAALFFNLWAVAALYIYAVVRGTCKKCGHLRKKGEKYCSHCGNAFETVCENCQASIPADAASPRVRRSAEKAFSSSFMLREVFR